MFASPTLRPARTRVFMNGNSQAVRIPQEFRLDCQQVEIHRNAQGELVLRPIALEQRRGDALLQALQGFDAEALAALEAERTQRLAQQEREAL